MRILGIDPGSRLLGFAVLDVKRTGFEVVDLGVYKFSEHLEFNQRLKEVGDGMQELLTTYKPTTVSLEKIFLGKSADSAFKLGHARGVVIHSCVQNQVAIFEYATRVVKKGITGKGSADKLQVRATLEAFLKMGPIRSLDASDALALAVHHGLQMKKGALAKAIATGGVNL